MRWQIASNITNVERSSTKEPLSRQRCLKIEVSMSHAFDAQDREAAAAPSPRRQHSDRRTSTFKTTMVMRSRLRVEERRLSGARPRKQIQDLETTPPGGLPAAVGEPSGFATGVVDGAL